MKLKCEILWGINNIYAVKSVDTGLQYEAIIKGKVLQNVANDHNPLVCGDFVIVNVYDYKANKAYILERLERKNVLWRYNKKSEVRQTIAANFDIILIIVSANVPELKTAFLDRCLIIAEEQNINPIIVINKIDKGIKEENHELIEIYKRIGYIVLKLSALKNNGVTILKEFLKLKRTVFLGQSGVGKSSLINTLSKRAIQVTKDISLRYARGKHTTVYALSIFVEDFIVIDTPGIKELGIETIPYNEVRYYFKEINALEGICKFNTCLHLNEPGCNVRLEVNKKISHIRYASYIRIVEELKKYKIYGK